MTNVFTGIFINLMHPYWIKLLISLKKKTPQIWPQLLIVYAKLKIKIVLNMSRQRSQLNPVQSSASSHLSQKNCRIWNHKHSRSSKRKWHHWIGPGQEPSISQNSHVCSSDCSSLWSSPHCLYVPILQQPPPTRSRYWRSLIKQNFWELQKIVLFESLYNFGGICVQQN